MNFEIFPLSFAETLIFREYAFEADKSFTRKKIDELRNLFKEYSLYGGYPKIALTSERDKKEIDFILRIKNGVLPQEVRLNFEQFSRTAVDYFYRHYETDKYKIVGLNGQQKNAAYIYPWDL